MIANLSVDVTSWFRDFQRDLDALLSDMLQLSAAAEENRYSDDAKQKVGIMSVNIPNSQEFGETAPQRAARNAFIGVMSKFSLFLDRLIAIQRVENDGMPIQRALNGQEEIIAYIKEFLEEAVAEVARDPGLTLPKKLDCFTGVDSGIRNMALNYNALRNALEHHHDLPKRELKVTIRRIVPVAGDQEITALPVTLPVGESLGIKLITVEKVFPANKRVVLELQDGYDLLYTLRYVIAPPIFEWSVDSGNAQSASGP